MSILKDLRDLFKIIIMFIIMLPAFIFFGVLLLVLGVARLLSFPFVKFTKKPGTKEETPTLKVGWNFEHDRTYVPSTVHCSVRGIADSERKLLGNALGLFSSGAVAQEFQVEILQMQVQEAWILHFCDPDCCPPEMLLKIDESNYLFVGGKKDSDLFADKEYCLIPFTRSLEITRTLKSHIPLQFVRTGEPVVHNERNANVQMDFEPVKGFYCEFLKMHQLPQGFKDGFTPLKESPTDPSHSFIGPSRGDLKGPEVGP